MSRVKTINKRLIAVVLAITIILSLFATNTLTIKAEAASKWNGYLKISTAEDLLRMEESENKFYLTKDIDLKDYGIWTPISGFKGTLDGNSFVIKNLNSTKDGLFYSINNATIKNLGIINLNIKSTLEYAGGIASFATNSIIESCYVTGKIESIGEYTYAGGITGGSWETGYKNCINIANVIANGNQKQIVGGITGFDEDGASTFQNCINIGIIQGKSSWNGYNRSGGIVGDFLNTKMSSCFNIGNVSNGIFYDTDGDEVYGIYQDPAGDLVGEAGSNAYMVNCGYLGKIDIGKAASNCMAQATKMTAATLKKQSTYKGWDFKNTWYIDSKINNGYPILQTMLKNYSASKPTAYTKSGTYAKRTKLSFSTSLSDVTIYYTTNGKNPTTSSNKYTNAITLEKDTKIKIAVFTNGKQRGAVATYNYKVK